MEAYNENEVPVQPPIKEIKINLVWSDGFGQAGKDFSNMQGLANFLKVNPVLAEGVGFVPKRLKS